MAKTCDDCLINGCKKEKEWGHPCDKDEHGYYICEVRVEMLEYLGIDLSEYKDFSY